jgi:hypothetical protein
MPFIKSDHANTLILLIIAFSVAMLHMCNNQRYYFHADEWQFLSDASHLDWGFVPYPPLTAFLGHIGLSLFGLSLPGLRFFAVIAQAIVIIIVGLMARELGGGRLASIVAALAVAFSPLPLSQGTRLDYTGFDFLWWVLAAYFTLRLLKSKDHRWWLAIGMVIGLGLETKYTMVFFITGLLGGMVLTDARRYFLSPWFYAGVGVAWLIFLPNFLWQVRHDFITYHFLKAIHYRDTYLLHRADYFLADQFLVCINPLSTPLIVAGLVFLLRDPRYRMLAWLCVIPVMLLWLCNGRSYYAAGAYPLLIATGSVVGERWLSSAAPYTEQPSRRTRRAIAIAFFTVFSISAAYMAAQIALVAPGTLRDYALGDDSDVGWGEVVRTVADVAHALPAGTNFGILTTQYSLQGAIEMLGPAYHLPTPLGLVNSAWLRGYPNPPPTSLIVVGLDSSSADRLFSNCQLAATYKNSPRVKNIVIGSVGDFEIMEYSPVFVCGSPRLPWNDFWRTSLIFG